MMMMMVIMMNLNDLAIKHNTDKSTLNHGYTKWYDMLFSNIREEPLTIVEIGVWEGASLRMWREYFPNATITGVDKVDREIQVDGVDIIICGQDDPDLISTLPNPIDILIDDASHINSLTVQTFQNLFPLIKSGGGMYVIEDLQTSYDQVNYDGDPNPDTAISTAMQYCKRLTDELNKSNFPAEYRLGYSLQSVQFFPNMCVLVKE